MMIVKVEKTLETTPQNKNTTQNPKTILEQQQRVNKQQQSEVKSSVPVQSMLLLKYACKLCTCFHASFCRNILTKGNI